MMAEDRKDLTLYAGQGVAVREVVMAKGHGLADYLPRGPILTRPATAARVYPAGDRLATDVAGS